MSEWISVEERLPESREPVIVCDGEQTGWFNGFCVNGVWMGINLHSGEFVPMTGITHWMPLPEPPND